MSQVVTISFFCLSLRGFCPHLHQTFWDKQPVPKAFSCYLQSSAHTTAVSEPGWGLPWGWMVHSLSVFVTEVASDQWLWF